MSDATWVSDRGRAIGPFAVPALRALLLAGSVRPDEHAWSESERRWVPLREMTSCADLVSDLEVASRRRRRRAWAMATCLLVLPPTHWSLLALGVPRAAASCAALTLAVSLALGVAVILGSPGARR